MIKLEVEAYCHDCPLFKADVESNTAWWGDNATMVSHVIRCDHRKQCDVIKEYLNKEATNK